MSAGRRAVPWSSMRFAGLRFRALAAVVAVLVSAACGQKAGVGGPDIVAALAALPSHRH